MSTKHVCNECKWEIKKGDYCLCHDCIEKKVKIAYQEGYDDAKKEII